ncbi:uncharacterized protein LOC144749529 [Ciona intestinalis]
MESTEHDFIQDEVGGEEKNLAQQLKDLCDSDGKEMQGTKLRAALILHELAKIYKQKDEKLNMTRSAALYNAAIVRDPQNQTFKGELKALCSAVLVKANATRRDADLISLAAEVKKKLEDLRKEFGERFNQLEIIRYGLEDDQLIKLQKKKVLDVKNIQQGVTRRYTALMRFISDECVEIMGTPPCKYAVVGLGSLARSEITLYSDFEHIIVLDNDAKIEDREMIMKYFGWFTTIFNIILINLGETMINCVAIPSLNPRYRDWFMDIVTPNGVTFDGMVAHACIRPLGRPATKDKPWHTEFIKPVDKMIQYLDSDEQVKQGYHVAEVLSKACFVAGDEVICAEYQVKAHLRIKENDENKKFLIVSIQIEKKMQNFDPQNLYTRAAMSVQNYNIKRAIYRSATIFISAIGRLHSLQASSCFDVIDGLIEIGVCNKVAAHQFRFMVAVACEFRAKVYHSKGQQDDVFMEGSVGEELISGLIEIVGKQSLVSFTTTVLSMQQSLNLQETDYRTCKFVGEDPIKLKTTVLGFLGLNEDLVELLVEQTNSLSQDDTNFNNYAVGIAFYLREYDLVIDMCSKISQIKFPVNQIFKHKVYELASIVRRSYNMETKSFNYSRSEVEAKVQELEEMMEILEPESIYIDMFSSIHTFTETLCLFYNGKIPNNSNIHTVYMRQILKWKHVIVPKDDTMGYIFKTNLLYTYGHTLLINKEYTKALKLLDEVNQMIQSYENTTVTHTKLKLHDAYAIYHINYGRYNEAFICLLECARICKRLKQPIETTNAIKYGAKKTFQQLIFRHSIKLCESSETLLNNGKSTEALKLLDEAKQLIQPYKNTTTVAHMDLYNAYAVCYKYIGRYYEAIICWLEYVGICKRLKQPIPDGIKPWIKNTFYQFLFGHPMKLCKSALQLINNGKSTEALKLLDEAKQILQPYKNTTTVVHELLCWAYADCYHHTGRYCEAFICWLEYARICNELKRRTHDAFKQNTNQTFQQLMFLHFIKLYEPAATLTNNGKHTEALKLLDEAKQMLQPYKNTTTVVHELLYHGYAVCYNRTGIYIKALVCWLECVRICNELNIPIHGDIKPWIKDTFQQFIFHHSMKLCKYAKTLMVNGKPSEALKLLDEAKQMMQPYKNTTTVVHRQLYFAYAVCYNNTGRYYEAMICLLEYVGICKKLKKPISDKDKQRMKDAFQQFIFRHPMKLWKSAGRLMDNGKPTEALKLLDEAKQLIQPYKNTTTEIHRQLYGAYAVCYQINSRYYEALICWLESQRIRKKLKQPIHGNDKQWMKGTFHRFIFRHLVKLCESAVTLINNEKSTEALKLLNEAKQLMQLCKNTTTEVQMYLHAICYDNTHRYYEALICWLEFARICKKLKKPISDIDKQRMKDAFQRFIFRQSIKLCESAATLKNNGNPTDGLKLLNETKQLMQETDATTEMNMRRYATYAVCYQHTGRYYEALICWMELARICNELKEPIPDVIKQITRECFYLLKSQHH